MIFCNQQKPPKQNAYTQIFKYYSIILSKKVKQTFNILINLPFRQQANGIQY